MRLKLSLLMLATLSTLSACDNYNTKNAPPPSAPLTRELTLMGADGNRYGTVELDPITGGRMYDTQGRLIGTIVMPVPNTTTTTTTVTPATPIAPLP